MKDSQKKNKDLLKTKALGVKSEKPSLKAKKTGNSIRKTKSKAQGSAQYKTLVGIKSFFPNEGGKEEVASPAKEHEIPPFRADSPVKQEFIVRPF